MHTIKDISSVQKGKKDFITVAGRNDRLTNKDRQKTLEELWEPIKEKMTERLSRLVHKTILDSIEAYKKNNSGNPFRTLENLEHQLAVIYDGSYDNVMGNEEIKDEAIRKLEKEIEIAHKSIEMDKSFFNHKSDKIKTRYRKVKLKNKITWLGTLEQLEGLLSSLSEERFILLEDINRTVAERFQGKKFPEADEEVDFDSLIQWVAGKRELIFLIKTLAGKEDQYEVGEKIESPKEMILDDNELYALMKDNFFYSKPKEKEKKRPFCNKDLYRVDMRTHFYKDPGGRITKLRKIIKNIYAPNFS